MMGELVGAAVEFAIGDLLVATYCRDGVGRARDLGLEQLMHSQLARKRRGGLVPFDEQLPALRFRQQGQQGNGTCGIGHHRFEQHLKMSGHAQDAFCVEQFCVVMKPSFESAGGFGHRQREIALEVWEQRRGDGLQRERDLKHRPVGEFRPHQRERRALIGERIARGLIGARENFANRRGTVQCQSQRQRVRRRRGRRGADEEIVHARVTVEQGLKRCEQGGEGCDAFGAAEGVRRVRQIFRQCKGMNGGAKVSRGGAGPVAR